MLNSPLSRSCPVCTSTFSDCCGQKAGFDIQTCQTCRTLYVARLPEVGAGQDYDAYYSPANLTTPVFVGKRLDEIAASFLPYRQSNRLLDVGFGAGDLLQASVRAGWGAEGIEVSHPAVMHAQSLGLKVFHGGLEEARYPDDHFDVVTAVEVLEHVPDPLSLVREVARILRPGGLFWATTPHGAGISIRLLKTEWSVVNPPEHLQLFSVKGMRALLTAAGFGRVQIATQGVNPYEIVHRLRGHRASAGDSDAADGKPFSRVESGYRLNESLTSSPSRRALKNSLNSLLNVSRLGDSLKIRAVL